MKACIVCGAPFEPMRSDQISCSQKCSHRRALMQNKARKKLAWEQQREQKIRAVTKHPRSLVYSDDMAGSTIVRTTSRSVFVGLPVTVLIYERRTIGGKSVVVQEACNAWIESIEDEIVRIAGARVNIEFAVSSIQKI